MKLIPLSQFGKKHKGKYFAKVDDEDYDFLMQWRWMINFSIRTKYAKRNTINNEGNKTLIAMQRIIMNCPDNFMVDHIDRDGLNNQKSNLRLVTRIENGYNRTKNVDCVSKFKGVTFNKSANRWQVQIVANGKRYYCGVFKKELDAAKAYNEVALKYHGEFAVLNKF